MLHAALSIVLHFVVHFVSTDSTGQLGGVPGPTLIVPQQYCAAAVQFLFEDYVLDLDRRELTRGSKAIATEPQVFDLLVHLVQNREHVVSKDNLLDVVWG